jgi:hypothetical protein
VPTAVTAVAVVTGGDAVVVDAAVVGRAVGTADTGAAT